MGDKSAFVGIVTKLFDITGKALSGEWGTDDPDGCGIPVLRTTNFTNVGKVNYDNVVTRNIQKKNISDKLLKKGDIIIEKSGGTDKNPVGRVIYFEGEENKYLFNNFTGLLRVKDKNEWYPKYVFYSMFAYYKKGGTRRFENKTTGLHNLKLDDYIKRLDIQKASYVNQVHVCKLLDCVRFQIDNMERELELLDELVKARFVEMFGDPVINSCQFPVQPMTDICDIIDGDRGKNYPKSEEILDDGYCLFLNAKNVTQKGFDFENCNFITREKNDALRNGKLSRGDVVLTTRGTVGNLAYYSKNVPYENIRINSGMVILRMNRSILNEIYFIELFKMKLSDIKEKIASGSAQPQLPISTMNKIILMIPPLELQNQFASFVQEIDKSRSRIQKSLEASQELFDSLMQEYFG